MKTNYFFLFLLSKLNFGLENMFCHIIIFVKKNSSQPRTIKIFFQFFIFIPFPANQIKRDIILETFILYILFFLQWYFYLKRGFPKKNSRKYVLNLSMKTINWLPCKKKKKKNINWFAKCNVLLVLQFW